MSGSLRISATGPVPPAWLGPTVALDALDEHVPGFDLRNVTVWAMVRDGDDVADVLHAIQRGADVVIHLALTEPDRAAFLDEVRRIATDVRELEPPTLDDDQRALVEHLRHGCSLREAAALLHISSRTADRRLAEIRTLLGVATTAEVLQRVSPT